MPRPDEAPADDAAQAAALLDLLDAEPAWRNLASPVSTGSPAVARALLAGKRRAFDAYQAELVAYNQRFQPAHLGMRPVTLPKPLAACCRTMADLYRRAEPAEFPVHL